MGSSTTTSATATKAPWAPALGNLQGILSGSAGVAGNNAVWTPTQSAATQTGLGALSALGTQPSFGANTIENTIGLTQPGLATGLSQLEANASGANLDPRNNPYFVASTKQAMQDASDQVQSQFAGAGRIGSAADTKVLSDRLGNIANTAYGNQYNTNLGYQNQGAATLGQLGLSANNLAPQVGSLQAQQAGFGLAAGQAQDQFAQAARMAPATALSWQSGITAPIASLGGTQDSTGTTQQNPGLAGTIGGLGMLAGGLYGGGGGLLGGIGGMFGGQATSASNPYSYNMPSNPYRY